MAAKGAREPITLECTECKRRNYMTEKNKKNNKSQSIKNATKHNVPITLYRLIIKEKQIKET